MKTDQAMKLAAAEHPTTDHEAVKRILLAYFDHLASCPACEEDGQIKIGADEYEMRDADNDQVAATQRGRIKCPRCGGKARDPETTFWYCEVGDNNAEQCESSHASSRERCGWAVLLPKETESD